MKRAFFLVLVLSVCGALSAQPHKYGCDYFRNLGPKRKPLTTAQRSMLNESIARSDTFDIVHYEISIDVTDYSGGTIIGETTVDYAPKLADQTMIRFDLMQLTVDSVVGELVSGYDHDGMFLDIQFFSPPAVDDTLQVTVYYHGEPYQDPTWGGFYFESQYIYNLGIGLTTIPPNFGKVWYPCFDSFVERATYRYHVKSAGTYRAWCQGDFVGETALEGDTVIRSFELLQQIPTHLSAIAVADYVNYEYTHTGVYGDVPVTLRAKPNNMAAMQNVFVNLGDAIDACEYWYGPNGWSRVGYVLTTDGALEIPTNIAYPQFMVGQAISDNNSLLSHELGHHWWGDLIAPHIHNDMWLKEGPAEYSSHLMVEWMDGEEEFITTVKENQLYVLENAHIDDEGFHPMSPMPDEQIYGRHTYYKGASVMHNLRGYMGDELFRQGMSGVIENHSYTDMTPDEFKTWLEDETGLDLDPFFDAQIYLPGFATFVVDSFAATPAGNLWNVDIHIQQKLRECPEFYTQVPLDVTVIGSNWEREEFQVMVSGEFSTVSINSMQEPAMIVLNGHNRLNQNRMDHEVVIYPDEPFNSNIPYVDFRLFDELIIDSTFVRVEHVWSGPDDENLGEGIYAISGTHYWTVDGFWPEGTGLAGRIYYRGSDEFELDFDLFGSSESDAVLVYRADASQPWEVYGDYTLTAGDIFNGNGNIRIDVLQKGQYAFANGDPSVGLPQLNAVVTEFHAFPVPADGLLTIAGSVSTPGLCRIDILDMNGRCVMKTSVQAEQEFRRDIDVSGLDSGSYVLVVKNPGGVTSKTIQIAH